MDMNGAMQDNKASAFSNVFRNPNTQFATPGYPQDYYYNGTPFSWPQGRAHPQTQPVGDQSK